MTTRQLIGLAIAAAVMVVAAVAVVLVRDQGAGKAFSPALLIPGFKDRVNDVADIEIAAKSVFHLKRQEGGRWVLSEKANYPVVHENVKKVILGLADARRVEPKTARADYYGRIGVADPGQTGGGTRLTFKTDKGDVLATVIVGKRKALSGRLKAWTYVRLAGQPQTWLVDALPRIEADPVRWLVPDLLEVKRDRVARVRGRHADGTVLEVVRDKPDDADFKVVNLPKGAKLRMPSIANGVGGALGYLSFDDVRPAGEIDFSGATKTVYTTFDGLIVTVRTVKVGDAYWCRFAARYDANAVAKGKKGENLVIPDVAKDVGAEAHDIDARVHGWAYRLPDYKAEDFTKRLDDMIEPPAKDKSKPKGAPGRP